MSDSSVDFPVVDDSVIINGKCYQLHMVTMKYIKDGFYNYYLMLRKFGLIRIGGYEDGEEIIKKFLRAVFQDDKVVDEVYENLNQKLMKEIVEKVKLMNELEDEEELKND